MHRLVHHVKQKNDWKENRQGARSRQGRQGLLDGSDPIIPKPKILAALALPGVLAVLRCGRRSPLLDVAVSYSAS
jgi:hypothetical protein